jgi:hypothetical protein
MSPSAGLSQTVVAMREARASEAPPARAAAAHAATPGPAAAVDPGTAHAAPRAAEPATPAAPVRSAFLPLLLGLLALVAVLGHQAWQLDQDRRQLQAAHDGTAPRIEAATRLRRSLDLLAADTQRLADSGNAPARVLVEELRRRGITINTAATATGTADTATGTATGTAAPAASR